MSSEYRRAAREAASDLGRAMHHHLQVLGGAAAFARRPTLRGFMTTLSEALVRSPVNRASVAYMLRDPRVAQLCRERYTGSTYAPDVLLHYPPGSLGHELAKAMIAHDYDPEFYRDFYGDGPYRFKDDEEYLRFRNRQIHDIVHVLTGFGMVALPGELGMQAFLAAQTRRPFSVALLGLGFLRTLLRADELPETLGYIAKGLALGSAADTLLAHRFEEDWSKSVETWRQELGLTPQDEFSFETLRRVTGEPDETPALRSTG